MQPALSLCKVKASAIGSIEKTAPIGHIKRQKNLSCTHIPMIISTDSQGAYKDGTYTGSAEGFGGNVDVKVTIEAGKISSVDITAAEKEDGAYLAMAEDIIPSIISAQSADVDTVSGATFSSTAIRNATKQALEKAVK